MNRQEYTLFETRMGNCGIAWIPAGATRRGVAISGFRLPEKSSHLTAARLEENGAVQARVIPPEIATLIDRVKRHLSGEPQDFRDVVVDLGKAGEFSREVYAAARKIKPGKTMTYGEVARAIGRPKSARAVGRALAVNPIPLIIPCHRVLAAGNRAGGFSAPGGVATKEKMLAAEGAEVVGIPAD